MNFPPAADDRASGTAGEQPAAGEIDDLTRGTVHLWHIDLDPARHEWAAWEPLLAVEERERAAKISREPARRHFVLTRGLLRAVLSRYLRVSPGGLAFARGQHGKPRLAGSEPDRGLVFNVSHTHHRMVVALAFDLRLGIDIERWRPLGDAAGLAARCFAPDELSYWNQLPEAQRLPELFRLWTLKEALCKAVGRGLGLGMQRCVFDCSSQPPRLIDWPDTDSIPVPKWFFRELEGLRDMSGTIASDRPIERIRHFQWADDSVHPGVPS